jgi:hypothetical protein
VCSTGELVSASLNVFGNLANCDDIGVNISLAWVSVWWVGLDCGMFRHFRYVHTRKLVHCMHIPTNYVEADG